jgi:hypothetical protein
VNGRRATTYEFVRFPDAPNVAAFRRDCPAARAFARERPTANPEDITYG